jgi:hypothetical protein
MSEAVEAHAMAIRAPGSPGVIAAGGSGNITAGTLSNAGSTNSAGLDVNLNLQSLNNDDGRHEPRILPGIGCVIFAVSRISPIATPASVSSC